MNKKFIIIVLVLISCSLLTFSCGKKTADDNSSNEVTISNPTFDESNITTEAISVEIDGQTVTASQEVVADQALVVLASGKTENELESLLSQNNCSIIGKNTLTNTYQIQIPSGQTPYSISQTLSQSDVVDSAGSNPIIYGCLRPNDDYSVKYNDGWSFSYILAEEAWELTTGNSTLKVAVVDTGLHTSTSIEDELASTRIENLTGSDLIDNDNDPTDAEDIAGHGTYSTSIIAAKGDNYTYMAGMNWNCKVQPIRALKGTSTSGKQKTDFATYINGITLAAKNGAKVINCSAGGYLWPIWNSSTMTSFSNAATLAKSYGAILVCSAGNDNADATRHYPSYLTYTHDNVISVGGVKSDSTRWVSGSNGSNYGTYVDIAAPGHNVWAFGKVNGLAEGTSVAAPFVSGTASLMFSLAETYSYSLTPSQIKTILTSTSYTDALSIKTLATDYNVGRKLNAYGALLGVLEKCSKAVISVTSNVSGAAIYLSSDGGTNFTDTGKTTSTSETKKIIVDAGTNVNYVIKLTKTGYSPGASNQITGITAGTETEETITMSSASTTTTTTTTTTSTTTTTTTTTSTTLGSYTDTEYGSYSHSVCPKTISISIPSGATVYIGNLEVAGDKPGFFPFGHAGYMKINNVFLGYDKSYNSSADSTYVKYYYKNSGDNKIGSTDSSYSNDYAYYKNTTSLQGNGTWVDITSCLNLGETNTFKFYHFTAEPKGFVLRIYQ